MIITVYDGAGTIGGNKIYVGNGKHGVFLDFGLNFSVSNRYFKEFINTRAIRGIHDFIEMGLAPKLKIYREDLYPGDMRGENFESLPVDAVLISHAHMDHYGLLGLVDMNIPIVASPETLAIIKAYQDAGQTKIESSVIYSPMRESSNDSSTPIIKSTGNRIRSEENARKYLKFREIIPTEPISPQLDNYLKEMGKKYKTKIAEEKMRYGSVNDLEWKIQAFPVDHSIYGSCGFLIETEEHSVAYTGDLRTHGERASKTEKFIENVKNVEVLITEGTRVSDGEHVKITEKEVNENCSEAVGGYDGTLIIADFSARNFERLKAFAKIAEEHGRKLVVTEKDAYGIMGLLAAGTDIDTDNIVVYMKPSDKNEAWKEILKESNVWAEKTIKPKEIGANPEEYILAFSLYDMPNLMDIKPEGGMYIYSATEAFNEDMELDFITLGNWLNRYGIEIVGFKIENGRPQFDKELRKYHASGHIGPEELQSMIDDINPEIVIPVHTENPEWFAKNFENVKIPKNGALSHKS